MDIYNELLSLARLEITQRREEGCDVAMIEQRFENATARAAGSQESELHAVLRDLEGLKPIESFPYVEPSTLDQIRDERPHGPRRVRLNLSDAELFDRIHGAWLGRAAGCTLGKPVEGWPKAHIDDYLAHAGATQLDDYIPLIEDHPGGFKPRFPNCTRGHISYMARDDDMDYTVLGLHVLESHGVDFTSGDVARIWLDKLPYHLVYTAERAAYRNLVNNIEPPESALHRNPFREWIGAQIRADAWGYVSPGWPEKAAELAFRDAQVSHVKNGIYGEMFVAAMLAASFITDNVEQAIAIGLSEIPRRSRLAEAIRNTVAWSKELAGWEQVWARIDKEYGHYHAIHTINNAAVVVMGLMAARRNYETCITVAVRGGWDTDCNGATAGSVCGAMLGARALPPKWIAVLNDRLESAVMRFNECSISALARRTCEIARGIAGGAQ